LAGYADIFYRNVKLSGKIPQISAIMGPCAGGAVYSPALTDFTIMVKDTSYMFVTGPNVVKTVTYEDITSEALGGAQTHAQKSGVTHLTAENDYQCLDKIRKLLSYLPQNYNSSTIEIDYTKQDELRPVLNQLVPENPRRPYDVRLLLDEICDNESLLEIQEDYAKNIFIGFGRLAGKSIGIVANQPIEKAGCLDVACSEKAARFVRTCDCYNIPLLVMVDVPGFLPGKDQEWNGIIKNGAKLLYAFCEATTPRISVITRKAYGGAYDVMNSKHIGADMNFAWPRAEIAVMGAKGASEIVFRKEIMAADSPKEKQLELEKEYAEKFANPYCAASLGFIDEVIFPHQTRIKLIKAFELVREKDFETILKKHGNIPL
ncbi:MAG: acyl-CoA carboxylase subunit beta, partial [Bacteroidota bacterium]